MLLLHWRQGPDLGLIYARLLRISLGYNYLRCSKIYQLRVLFVSCISVVIMKAFYM